MAKKKRETGGTLDAAIKRIEKSYGKGAIVNLTSDSALDIEAISTGSLGLDRAIGVGGIPRGRIIELYGPEGSGKTTIAIQVVANAQAQGLRCGYIDMEHSFDPEYAKALGVDLNGLLFTQPTTGEEGLEIAEQLASTGEVGLIVVDSVAALTPQAELEGSMSDSHVGLQARLMSKGLRKLTALMRQNNTTLLFINQIREKVGVMFGSPETTPGGRALKFYASLRLNIRRIGQVKEKEDIVGNRTRVTVVKNKVASPMKKAEFDLIYGHGVDYEAELLELALETGVIEKAGAFFTYGEEKVRGRSNMIEALRGELGETLEAELFPNEIND